MQTLKASDFKARCLSLMDEVQKTGDEIVITKNGKPVSKLVPYRVKAPTFPGLHKGRISSEDRDIFSTGDIGIRAAGLGDYRGGPADRMIAAPALQNSATLLTAGERLLSSNLAMQRMD